MLAGTDNRVRAVKVGGPGEDRLQGSRGPTTSTSRSRAPAARMQSSRLLSAMSRHGAVKSLRNRVTRRICVLS